MIVAEESGSHVILLEHRHQGSHLRIAVLPPRYGGDGRMMGCYEAERRLLAQLEIFFQPLRLLLPESLPRRRTAGRIPDVAVQDDEMRVAPVERVVGHRAHLKEIVELPAVALVVPECGEERHLTQQVLFDIEKERPHVPYERACMAIRFTDYFIGTQFHPEADALGMTIHLKTAKRKKIVIENHGIEKWKSMIEQLNDPDKILWTHDHILPNFLNIALNSLHEILV